MAPAANSRWRPRVTVAAVVESEGRFLFVEETARGRRVLNQPAGHLEPGEGLVQAAIRETLEETATDIEPEALVAVFRWCHPTKPRTFLRFTFAARVLRRHPERALDDVIHRTLWLTPEELRAERGRLRSPLVLKSLEAYLAGQRYPLDLLQDLG